MPDEFVNHSFKDVFLIYFRYNLVLSQLILSGHNYLKELLNCNFILCLKHAIQWIDGLKKCRIIVQYQQPAYPLNWQLRQFAFSGYDYQIK